MRRTLAALALLVAACGSSTTTTTAPPETTPAAASFPVTIDTASGPVTLESAPQRIVSLSASATETLFAIGAGDRVAAADDASNHPAEAPTTDLNGFTATAESVAALDPDLVVYFFDPGDLGEGLATLGIPALYQPAPATIDDAYAQIEQLGAATGRVAEAARLVADMAAGIAEIESEVAAAGSADLTYYYELDETYYSLTSATFVGTLLSRLGMASIADPADEEGFGYPQLSAEFILQEDPDLIFLADTKCCGQDAETVAGRPGWDALTAVAAGGVVALDDDVASRWGPRIVDLLRVVADGVLGVSGADA